MKNLNLIDKTDAEINSLMNCIPLLALWIDDQLNIKSANDLFFSLIDKPQDDVIGTSLNDYPFHYLKQYFAHIDLLRNRDKDLSIVDQFDIHNSKKSVRFFIKEVSHANSFLILGIDISKEIIRQKAFEETRQQQEESARLILIGQISVGVAHGINNPLAIISAFLFKMKRSLEQDISFVNKDEFLKNIAKSKISIDRIAMIVRGLKFLEKNVQNAPFEKIHVQEIANSVIDIFSEKFKVSGIELIIGDTSPDMIVYCRPAQITQVILNLLMNSHDALENCEIKWAKVIFKINQNNLTISVIDSGPGIPAEVRSKMMQPFFSTKKADKGVGLGLSTSKIILQDHKGDLVFDESSPNTKFNLVLRL